jgi:hypothetical protein
MRANSGAALERRDNPKSTNPMAAVATVATRKTVTSALGRTDTPPWGSNARVTSLRDQPESTRAPTTQLTANIIDAATK